MTPETRRSHGGSTTSQHLPSRAECSINRPLSCHPLLLPSAFAFRRVIHMPLEHGEGYIYWFVAVPAPDFHPGGIDVTLGLESTLEWCMTAVAIPLLQLVLERNAALTGRRGDDLVPSGVYRIHLRSVNTKCQRFLFRHGHKSAARISVISRGKGRGDLTWDFAGCWNLYIRPFFSNVPPERRIWV